MEREEPPFDDEPVPEEKSAVWRPPARCPECRANQTRFVGMNYEMSVYECDVCGTKFEAEDEG